MLDQPTRNPLIPVGHVKLPATEYVSSIINHRSMNGRTSATCERVLRSLLRRRRANLLSGLRRYTGSDQADFQTRTVLIDNIEIVAVSSPNFEGVLRFGLGLELPQ
jgi:hypothetical protein